MKTRVSAGVLLILLAAALSAQEHGYTPADFENGARLYQASCAGCHGPDGDMVPGVELLRGQFRRATTDTEIARIIQTGIPGTTMPPSSFSETQAGTIVAYLRSMAPSSAAGPTRTTRASTASCCGATASSTAWPTPSTRSATSTLPSPLTSPTTFGRPKTLRML